MTRPLIGIAADVDTDRVSLRRNYEAVIRAAGGVPVLLAPPRGASGEGRDRGRPTPIARAAATEWLARVDGLLLTGGDDPIMEAFGVATHPKATPVHEDRQANEVALLDALEEFPHLPVFGICLGMQMMTLHAGGVMDQHLPDAFPTAADHHGNKLHAVEGTLGSGVVTSHHRQAMTDAGRLTIVGRSPDGLIEAVADPSHAFRLGVQWHPERTPSGPLGLDLVERFIAACRNVR